MGQMASFVGFADTAGNGTIFAQGISEDEAGHTIMGFAIFGLSGNEELMDFFEAFFSIVVIGIDHGEGNVQGLAAGKDSLAGSPWFFAIFRAGEAFREVMHILKYIGNVCNLLHTVSDDRAEFVFDVFSDDKNDLVKTGFQGIMDGIIHDDLAIGANRSQLFDASSKTAADTGCHNN